MPSEKCFGAKNGNLIRSVPLRLIKGTSFNCGYFVVVSGNKGIIISRNGTKLTVDFNHPLAGKSLIYHLKINRIVNDLQERLRTLELLVIPRESKILLEDTTLTKHDFLKDDMINEVINEIKTLIPEIPTVVCKQQNLLHSI